MPLLLIVSEIYGRKVLKWWKFRIFLNFLAHPVETPWPILTVLHQNLRRSVPYILFELHLEALRKIEMVAVLCTWFWWNLVHNSKLGPQCLITWLFTWSNIKNFTTQNNHPPFFEFLTPPPPAPWADGPQRGRGTSADIVPTHMKLGVDPSTRYWDIAQKPPKCTNSPVTKISFPPFSAPRGR